MRAIERILKESKAIAVVGISTNRDRPSHTVASYLREQGYVIIPVNPTIEEWEGLKAYPSLSAIPGPVDMVDIFRRSEDVPPVVDEAIKIGAKVVWMQEGIVNEEAASKAGAAGLDVVMDRCALKEHQALREGGRL
jgi:predicted CoA-binding protein